MLSLSHKKSHKKNLVLDITHSITTNLILGCVISSRIIFFPENIKF